jgi:CelD/BcsL family acetyltransferase involved in cellulose biosynthesis
MPLARLIYPGSGGDESRTADARGVDCTEYLAEEWNDLAARSRVAPFLRPDWICAWDAAFADGQLVAHRIATRRPLVGVLPLERRRRGVLSSPTAAGLELVTIAEFAG